MSGECRRLLKANEQKELIYEQSFSIADSTADSFLCRGNMLWHGSSAGVVGH
jgi:hypothetical protein